MRAWPLGAVVLAGVVLAGPRDLSREPVKGDDVCVLAASTKLRDDVPETVAIVGGTVELRLCATGEGARTPTRVGAGIYKTLPAWEKSSRWIAEAQVELARLRAREGQLEADLAACRARP